jgi:hypothetical protein
MNHLSEEITFIYHGGNTNNTGDDGAGTGRKRCISATDDDCGRGRGRFGGCGGHGHGRGCISGGRGGHGHHGRHGRRGGHGGTYLLNGVDVSNPTHSFSGAEWDALRAGGGIKYISQQHDVQ